MKSALKEYSTSLSVFFGLYIVLALNLNLAVTKQQMAKAFKPSLLDFLSLFKAYHIEQFFLFLFSYFLLKKCFLLVSNKSFAEWKCKWKEWFSVIIPAALFSSFMIVGFSFKMTGNASCISFSKYQLFKSLFVGGGYFILFICLIFLLFKKMDNISLFFDESVPPDFCFRHFYKYPFLISYLVLLVCYTPYMAISYPGIFMGDAADQICQGYNLQSYHPYVNLISEEMKLYNHHPVFHTVVLHFFIAAGKLICSYNFGVFLYAFFQMNLVIAAISFTIMILVRHFQLKLKYAFIILIYYLINPFVENYIILISKDVLFGVLFLLHLICSYFFLEKGVLCFKQYVFWLFVMIGMVLFRNEGIYLIVPTLIYYLSLNISKKNVVSALVICICFFLTWHYVIFPLFKITPGGAQEMFSIPFQQTARYVKYKSKNVIPSERQAIDSVLNYYKLGKLYNPNISDPVKGTFKLESTKKQRFNYLKTWAAMFLKEPKLYIGAIIANKFEFFYPEANLAWFYSYDWSERSMKFANNDWQKELSFDFHHLKRLKIYREKYEQIRTKIFSLPIFAMFRSASTYIWMFILLIFYTLRQSSKRVFALFVPFIIYFLVLMAGPCNGTYFRYLFPYVVTFPFLFIFIMHLKDKSKGFCCL